MVGPIQTYVHYHFNGDKEGTQEEERLDNEQHVVVLGLISMQCRQTSRGGESGSVST